MGLFNFLRDVGAKLSGHGGAYSAPTPEALENELKRLGLPADGVSMRVEGDTVHLAGRVPDAETREKIVLCCGNVAGVSAVNDQMTVATPADESRYYTVKSGDTLSKIAKEHYGDANAYMRIFEANTPMLKHPDKIYPGQNLRIPPKA